MAPPEHDQDESGQGGDGEYLDPEPRHQLQRRLEPFDTRAFSVLQSVFGENTFLSAKEFHFFDATKPFLELLDPYSIQMLPRVP